MVKERIVFVHGRDAAGAAAWKAQHGLALNYDCLFVRRSGFGALVGSAAAGAASWDTDLEIVLESLGEGGHLVAADDGAVPAMVAAVAHPGLVRSLVLAEPACFSLTRDLPATESYISAHGADSGLLPWQVPLTIVPGVPTLVLTGAWEPLYEEVAEYLATTGAVHLQVGGEHRPQDSPEGRRAVVDFIRAHRG